MAGRPRLHRRGPDPDLPSGRDGLLRGAGEYLPAGQRIEAGRIEADGRTIASFTVVGHKRICRFAPVQARALTIRITAARAEPALRLIAAYR